MLFCGPWQSDLDDSISDDDPVAELEASSADLPLPMAVASGAEPLIILGAVAGG